MADAEDIPEFEYLDTYLDEIKLIDRLILRSDNTIEFNLFSNLLSSPVGGDEYFSYKGFYIGTAILREALEFEKTNKPGDFDILIIPFSDDKIFYDRTCVFEVKIVRPRRNNPKRNANSMGEEQVYGLINDGFPLVGLIHICMTEPLTDNEKVKINYIKGGVGEGSINIPFDERERVEIKLDHFAIASSINQMKRLISKDFPKYVGLCTIGVNIDKENKIQTSFSSHFNHRYEAGYFNPKKSEETIKKIENYWKNNKDKFIIADR